VQVLHEYASKWDPTFRSDNKVRAESGSWCISGHATPAHTRTCLCPALHVSMLKSASSSARQGACAGQ
jgi:hypothetical protein